QKIMVSGGGKTSASVGLQGTLPDFEKAGTQIVAEGRFFSQFENDQNQNVCVVGSKVADDFFKFGSPVDQTIKISSEEYRVVGVLQKREQFLFSGGSDDQNNVIYLPYNVASKLKPNSDDVYVLAVAKPGMMKEAMDQVTDALRVRRQVPFGEPDNFGIETTENLISTFHSIAGGIGVMKIMLVSVTERTREIGVRKAIGARRKDIMWQFLIEAMTLTGFGGLVGLLIGWLGTLLVKLIMPSYVPLWAPAMGFVASVGIGMVFGLWPAWKAARLDPIESLRYE